MNKSRHIKKESILKALEQSLGVVNMACKKANIPRSTFYKWMKSRGKLGGQNKVPRLSNNRDYIDDLLAMLE